MGSPLCAADLGVIPCCLFRPFPPDRGARWSGGGNCFEQFPPPPSLPPPFPLPGRRPFLGITVPYVTVVVPLDLVVGQRLR